MTKTLEELIDPENSGWGLILDWKNEATNKIEFLDKNHASAEKTLLNTQVTTRSPMGAIIYQTGGILIDNGWIRILGSGNEKLNRTLPDWNLGKSFSKPGDQPTFLLIADDVIGGFFAINAGEFGEDLGKVFYFAPDSQQWENTEMSYSDFIWWSFVGDLNEFYEGFRWNDWQDEVSKLNGNNAMSFYPFLFLEFQDINELSRKPISIEEIWDFSMNPNN